MRMLVLPRCAKCEKKLPIDQAREEVLRHQRPGHGATVPSVYYHRHCRPKENAA
jgi:hypothetical protein